MNNMEAYAEASKYTYRFKKTICDYKFPGSV